MTRPPCEIAGQARRRRWARRVVSHGHRPGREPEGGGPGPGRPRVAGPGPDPGTPGDSEDELNSAGRLSQIVQWLGILGRR